jgi:hypothetical protein
MFTFVTLTQTCFACPSQWEGQLDDGRYVYIRYRWGMLKARTSLVSVNDAVLQGEVLYSQAHGDALAGEMSTADMLQTIGAQYDQELDERAARALDQGE